MVHFSSIQYTQVSLHLLGIKIEIPTCEMSILFIVFTQILLQGQLKPDLCLVSVHLGQVRSLSLTWYCVLELSCRGLKEFLFYGNLLLYCSWLGRTWDQLVRCEGFLFFPFLFYCAKLIL